MSDSLLVLGQTITPVDTIVQIFGSPSGGAGTLITALTVTNNTSSSVSYKAYIYSSSGEAIQAIVPMTIVVPDTYSAAPSAVNHVIPGGGTLRVENSASDSLSFTVTGRQQ